MVYIGPAFAFAVMLTQLSILFLYRRVFTMKKPWFRNTVYILLFFSVTTGLAFFFASLLSCTPFAYSWDKSLEGNCTDVRLVYIVALVANLVVDVAIVAAPIPLIWGLHMTSGTKWALSGMFLLGGLSVLLGPPPRPKTLTTPPDFPSVCLINLIRLPSLIHISESDMTCTPPPVHPPFYLFTNKIH